MLGFGPGRQAVPAAEEARRIVGDEAKWADLQGGEPVLLCDVEMAVDGELKRALAAIIVESPVEPVWAVVCDKEAAAVYVKSLKRAEIIERGIEEGLEYHLVVQVVKPTFLPATFTYCLKHRLQPFSRIDFEKVSGDLKEVHGSWRFVPLEGGMKTLLVYEVNIDPGKLIPGPVIRHSLRKSLPNALCGVRDRVAALSVSKVDSVEP